MNLPIKNKEEKNKMISKVKLSTSIDDLCRGVPKEFGAYMKYVRNLGFFEEPNYNYFKKLFRTLFLKMKYEYDDEFDWI